MTLNDLTQMYSTDETCRALLKKLRWPYGVECLRCKSKKVFELSAYAKFECGECGYQFSVTTQTIFHDTHLPLETWLMAVLLLVEARKGISANQIKRTLKIGSYKTAWYLCHRIRAAMAEAQKLLDGTVEVDETYIGGKPRPRRITRKKDVVIGIRQRGGDVRFIHAQDVKADTIYKILGNNVSEDVDVLITDEHPVYPFAMGSKGDRHETIRHKDTIYVKGNIHTNTVESAFSLLKRGIVGTWHKVSTKHLASYLNEMQFRFNRRKNPDLFIDTLRHMITADPLTFDKLTA